MLTPVGSDPSEWEGTHIEFKWDGMSLSGRTGVWAVLAKRGGVLGQVKWFGRWRKYSFYPAPDCVFEDTCLTEIAEFIKERTREQRTGL